jgi:hypothetical protein
MIKPLGGGVTLDSPASSPAAGIRQAVASSFMEAMISPDEHQLNHESC